MSLFDHVAPSERVADLAMVARRLRRNRGLEQVSILVVEGRTDEPAWGSLCTLGDAQVFSAGTRALVEQMAVLLHGTPVERCHCAYLVDCDASGKSRHLRHRRDLVVTETCDVESDLVELGVAKRVIAPFMDSDALAISAIAAAKEVALPLSVVRRAAHKARVSMKVRDRQFRLHEVSPETQHAWERQAPEDAEVVALVGGLLCWSTDQFDAVDSELGAVNRSPAQCLLGKDILDALFTIVCREGHGEIRGWSAESFQRAVIRALQVEDAVGWVVVERLRAWASACGCDLLVSLE